MSTHFDNVSQVIAREMVTAGVSEANASVQAAMATARILAGEPSISVIRELVDRYRLAKATKAGPKTSEPLHVTIAKSASAESGTHPRVLATVGGVYPTKTRSTG